MEEGIVGIDIGGTKIAIGIINFEGNILARHSFATEVSRGPDLITEHIAEEVTTLLAQRQIHLRGVGVGMAGQISSKEGIVHFAPNLRWQEFPFAQKLSNLLHTPVSVTNDVRAATWGEWVFGAAKGHQNLVCLFIGTGIGGGIVINGQMLEGATNCAGELGHMILDLNGPKCHCGNIGCFEALAGGWAIARMAQQAAVKDPSQAKRLLSLCDHKVEEMTAKVVSQAAIQGDILANAILDRVTEALIGGAVSIVNSLNPSCLVIGGGFIEGNTTLVSQIAKGIQARALKTAVKELAIVGTVLKNDAGIVGAATYVLKGGSRVN